MILHADARSIPLADESVNCVVTSPPYWQQRDYGYPEQLGQEPTVHEYLTGLVDVFAEVARVLKNDGTLWLNLGDCYASGGRTRTLENSTAKSTLADRPTGQQHSGFNGRYAERLQKEGVPATRNIRDVWPMAVARFADSHYATFPPELPRRCILAGCPEGGIVLDPFVGSGTTVMAAQDLGRHGVGLDLGAAYIPMAKQRSAQAALC